MPGSGRHETGWTFHRFRGCPVHRVVPDLDTGLGHPDLAGGLAPAHAAAGARSLVLD